MERLANTRLQPSLVWGADPAEGLVPELESSSPRVTGAVFTAAACADGIVLEQGEPK